MNCPDIRSDGQCWRRLHTPSASISDPDSSFPSLLPTVRYPAISFRTSQNNDSFPVCQHSSWPDAPCARSHLPKQCNGQGLPSSLDHARIGSILLYIRADDRLRYVAPKHRWTDGWSSGGSVRGVGNGRSRLPVRRHGSRKESPPKWSILSCHNANRGNLIADNEQNGRLSHRYP